MYSNQLLMFSHLPNITGSWHTDRTSQANRFNKYSHQYSTHKEKYKYPLSSIVLSSRPLYFHRDSNSYFK